MFRDLESYARTLGDRRLAAACRWSDFGFRWALALILLTAVLAVAYKVVWL